MKELDRLRTHPTSACELKRAKDYVVGQLRLGLESSSNQMMWVGENLLAHGRVIDPEETMRATQAVAAADIQKVAQTFLKKGRLSIAMVAPVDSNANVDQLVDVVKGF